MRPGVPEQAEVLAHLPWPPGQASGSGQRRPPVRLRPWILLGVLVLVVCAAIFEANTSTLQSWLFSRWAREADYSIVSGPGGAVLYPRAGVHDHQAGYTRLGDFRRRLEAAGFSTVEQTRFSPELTRLVRWGFSPPFREPVDTGLRIRDASGEVLYDFARRRPRFERFEDIPLPLLRTLLYIEDRRLADEDNPRRNPVVDWTRVAGAGARYVGRNIGLPVRMEGGSTLATQMEKYRHSAGGRTSSIADKFRQMMSASLKVYRDGPDTSVARRQVVLDYLNTVPLAAAPGFGEVTGIGEGLRVWFDLDLEEVRRDLEQPGASAAKARTFKRVVALVYAIRAPSRYLLRDRETLEDHANTWLGLLAAEGVVDADLARAALAADLAFPDSGRPIPQRPALSDGKATAEIRRRLAGRLGVADPYDLDRLHVDVTATIDAALQLETATLFRNLSDPAFVARHGLRAQRLLESSDPARVVYSLLLAESTADGNVVRVHADSYRGPFDVNSGMKMELGSTAKLRALVHYLDLVAELHAELAGADVERLAQIEREARDPLTRWAAAALARDPGLDLAGLLERALDRRYSANPGEKFFTGGGSHRFHNFDAADDRAVLSVREASVRSTNLVFVRLMRDIVRFHEARLPYDARGILENPDHPRRRLLLESIADEESRGALERAWARFRGAEPDSLPALLLGKRAGSTRHQAIVYFAWQPDGPHSDETGLREWLRRQQIEIEPEEARRLTRSYGSANLSLGDRAWLAGIDPTALWCAGRLAGDPGIAWATLLAESTPARQSATAWLLETRNRKAQDLRLRTRVEQDAFGRMTPSWKRLGFPFDRMVPSFASAIGSSADRPAALADLMGVLVNDGVRRPAILIEEVRLASGTPYYATLHATPSDGERVLPAEVARAVRGVLGGVVRDGTARRVRDAFVAPDGTVLQAGGKTGSGDNRVRSEARSRTAAFAFYVGERWYGVITASVEGPEAGEYKFTSSLPLAVLRLLAPSIAQRVVTGGEPALAAPPEIAAVRGLPPPPSMPD